MKKTYTLSNLILLVVIFAFYSVAEAQDIMGQYFQSDADTTFQNYTDSDGRVIWNTSLNTEYNYNITAIGQDDTANFNQKQSKTLNTINDITIGIKSISTNNSTNTASFFADKTFLIWGNNDGDINTNTTITKDFSSATIVESIVTATTNLRKWKIVVTDSVPTIKLSIPESMVSGTNAADKSYIMIVADDEAFLTNVTSATMDIVGANLEVDFYFEGTKYIRFGSTPEVSIGSRSLTFDSTDKYLTAGNVNDLANTNYTISAWVKRETRTGEFDIVSKRNNSHGYSFRINSENQFRMVWNDPEDGSNNIMETSATLPENEWHHICATYDATIGLNGTTSLYIDGHLEAIDDQLNPINYASDAHFMIGAAHHIKRQQKFGGSVDEVRVWDVALSGNQIRYIMNQEIENNSNFVDGVVLPTTITKNEIRTIPWVNLIAYYPMSTMVFGSIKDESDSGNNLSMINYNLLDAQTAPLPYKTSGLGTDWDDPNTWVNGDTQYLPGINSYLNTLETIDYNIVVIDHSITMDNSNSTLIPESKNGNRTLLGLIVNNGGALEVTGNTATNDGFGLTISHYLKLDGIIDLEGESQLIQTSGSDFDSASTGSLERDQQGTSDTFTYNYWSSPVAPKSNSDYTLSNIFTNVKFSSTGYNGTVTANDTINADYWIWKYANKGINNYSQWQHVRSTGSISLGEGFTMKGPGSLGGQNYVFNGQPNNGDFSLSISQGNDYLVGNPYPSAMDADEFIKDNMSDLETGGRNTNGSIINDVLYFWNHFSSGTHIIEEYEGGYATYTLMGGAVAINNDATNNTYNTVGTKIPSRYISVGQGFFVSATENEIGDSNEKNNSGQLLFKNSQRVFQKESASTSQFLKSNATKKQADTKNEDIVDRRKKIRLMFNSPDGYHRQLLVGADENATSNYDRGYDGLLIENNKEDMYWRFDNANFIVQAINNFNEDQTLTLGVSIVKDGIATLKIDDLENIDNTLNIFIHDKELNVFHNLKTDDYEVFLLKGEYLDRFEITFSSSLSQGLLGVDNIANTDLQVYFSNDKNSVVVHNPNHKNIQSIKIYNMLGQAVFESNNKTIENYIELKTNQVKNSAYIIKMKTNDNNVVVKKVLVK